MSDVVKSGIEVLEKNGWTKEVCARDSNNQQVFTDDPAACSFCVMGAIFKAEEEFYGGNSVGTLQALNTFISERRGYDKKMSVIPAAAYNDSCETKEEVIKLLNDFLVYLGDK